MAYDTSPIPDYGPNRTSSGNYILDNIDEHVKNPSIPLHPLGAEALRRAGAPEQVISGMQGQPQGIQNPPTRPIPTLAPQRGAMDETLPNGQPAMMAGTGIHMPTAPAMPLPGGTRGNAANNFNTTLSPGEGPQFQNWKSQYAPHDSGEDYDLRGAYKYGLTPSPENGHWSDRFKKPNEPTFSNESQYAQDAPEKAGSWNGDTYVPPAKAAITNPPQGRAPIQAVPQSAAEQQQIGRLTPLIAGDTGEHNRENTGTSGINQIHNPWGRVPLQILEALGTGFAPGLTSAIPGTQLHHNMLVNQAEGGIAEQEKIRKDEEAARLEAANEGHLAGETAHNYAQADALSNPQDKIATNEIELFQKDPNAWAQFHALAQKAAATKEPQFIKDGEGNIVGMIDPDMKVHSASDPNLDPQAKAIMEAAKPKPHTAEETGDIKNYHFAVTQGYKGSFEQWQKDEANRKNPRPPGETGTWELIEVNGKTAERNNKTGAIRPVEAGVARLGTAEKAEALVKPVKDAVTFGRTYLDSGDFNGSEDLALIDKAYQLMNSGTKRAPSPVQQKLIMESRSLTEGAAAKTKHYINPSATWLDDTQRKNLVKTMEDIAKANGVEVGGVGGGNTVPYVIGNKPYNIPADQEKDFLRDHPEAKKSGR